MHGKKAAESLAVTKLIGIILLVLVLVSVLIFLIKPDILNWIKNLPGYELPEEDTTIDYSQLPPDVQAKFCPVKTVLIGDMETGFSAKMLRIDWRKLYVIPKGGSAFTESGFYLNFKENKLYEMFVYDDLLGEELVFGRIASDGILNVDKKYIDGYYANERSSRLVRGVISLQNLKWIDGSYIPASPRFLCKSESQVKAEEKDYEETIAKLKEGLSKSITLYFASWWDDHQVDLRWDFRANKAYAVVKPDGNIPKCKTFPACASLISKDNLNLLEDPAIKNKISAEQIDIVRQLLKEDSPEKLVVAVSRLIASKSIKSINKLTGLKESFSKEEVSDLLFGVSRLPECKLP